MRMWGKWRMESFWTYGCVCVCVRVYVCVCMYVCVGSKRLCAYEVCEVCEVWRYVCT